jgi:hypothetical protein
MVIVRGSKFATVLLDLAKSLAAIERAYGAGPEWKEGAEALMEPIAIQTPPVAVDHPSELERYFASLLEGPFKETLEESGVWQPFGEIDVDTDRDGIALELEGSRLGATVVPRVRVLDVWPGRRTLRFSSAEASVDVAVDVARGEAVQVSLPKGLEPAPPLVLSLTAGGALIAGGATLIALAASQGGPRVGCLASTGAACPSALATTLGGASMLPRAVSPDAASSGFRPLPLGLGLAALGAGFAAAPTLIDDTDPFPWRSAGIALAAGVAAFVLGLALGGH